MAALLSVGRLRAAEAAVPNRQKREGNRQARPLGLGHTPTGLGVDEGYKNVKIGAPGQLSDGCHKRLHASMTAG